MTTESTTTQTTDQAAAEEPQPAYPDVQSWVAGVFVTHFPRRTNTRWCAKWWRHPEAVVVLQSLWQTWEGARLVEGPAGMADWLTRYFYPLFAQLCAQDGPFAACSQEPPRHSDTDPWPCAPVENFSIEPE